MCLDSAWLFPIVSIIVAIIIHVTSCPSGTQIGTGSLATRDGRRRDSRSASAV